MQKEAPFDAWDGEDLDTDEIVEADNAEETAMHLDPESVGAARPAWSDLTGDGERPKSGPVSYFEDEQPDDTTDPVIAPPTDEHDIDLEVLLERQHYAFPPPNRS